MIGLTLFSSNTKQTIYPFYLSFC